MGRAAARSRTITANSCVNGTARSIMGCAVRKRATVCCPSPIALSGRHRTCQTRFRRGCRKRFLARPEACAELRQEVHANRVTPSITAFLDFIHARAGHCCSICHSSTQANTVYRDRSDPDAEAARRPGNAMAWRKRCTVFLLIPSQQSRARSGLGHAVAACAHSAPHALPDGAAYAAALGHMVVTA
jgi:hypothetical protein